MIVRFRQGKYQSKHDFRLAYQYVLRTDPQTKVLLPGDCNGISILLVLYFD